MFNARSVNNKLPELHFVLYSQRYDVVMITESWLSKDTPDSMLDPMNRYVVVRYDRQSTGGGVCVFVLKKYSVVTVDIPEFYQDLEMCCYDILHGKLRCRLFTVYRSPSFLNMMRITECLCKFSKVSHHCIVAGDFNCPDIDWSALRAPVDGVQNILLDFSISQSFSQVVETATRGNNLLDVVLSNEPLAIYNANVLQPFSSSDHCQVEFSVLCDNACVAPDQDSYVKRYDWRKANYGAMADYISSVNWFELLTTHLTADTLWTAFSQVLQSAVDLFVPSRYVSSCDGVRCRRWYPAALRRAINRKRCLWRRHRQSPNDADALETYRNSEKKCAQLLREYEVKQEQKIVDSNNTGGFYRFVNSKLSCKRGIGALKKDNGDIGLTDVERANLLNDYFASVTVKDNGSIPVFDRVVPDDAKLESVDFSVETVLAAIRKLKVEGSSGPDGFPPVLFKRLAVIVAEPLSLIFNSFMSVGNIPRDWAHAIVTPVYKSGAASNVSNYRPISLTSVACKIMERVISSQMLSYLRLHGVISKQQHGFLSGRSTSSNLLEALNDWTLAVNDRKSIGAAYIDFAKAFDTVSHAKLLCKLQAHGVRGNLLHWIENFLSGRTQQTRVGNCLSRIVNLDSGVVQGSVLGPLLFVIFINDITNLFTNNNSECKCKLYADDLKLYSVLETDADCDILQQKLNAIYDWSCKWQLLISYKKCNAMYVGNLEHNFQLLLNGNPLPVANEVKDLGVFVDDKLTFTSHVNQIVKRAFSRANLIHKCFLSRDVGTLTRAFCVYVRPMLEYASCIWSPHLQSNIQKVESVQRKFTKRLPGFKPLDYKARLLRLGLDSLEMRRLQQDLVYTYKILFGHVNVDANDFFVLSSSVHSSFTRGHRFKLFPRRSRLDSRKFFFAERIVSSWNNLPAEDHNFSSVAAFKRFIATVDLSQFVSIGF